MITDVFDMVTTLAVNRLNLVKEIFQRIDFFNGSLFGAALLAEYPRRDHGIRCSLPLSIQLRFLRDLFDILDTISEALKMLHLDGKG